MNITFNSLKFRIVSGLMALVAVFVSINIVRAAPVPSFSLTGTSSSVNISVTNANPNTSVLFYFPNNSSTNSTNSTINSFTSIDIGQTNSSGSFNVNVSPNSYGLTNGVQVYVSVDGAKSSVAYWPSSGSSSSQSGMLSLSRQSVTMYSSQTASIFPMNTANNLTLQGNSNTSVVSASINSTTNSLFLNGMNTGSSTVTVCAGEAGCSSVNVSIMRPTQTVTFGQAQAYVVAGQSAQRIGVYGATTFSTVSNSNKDIVTATIDGSNLVLTGLLVGQVTITVCADGLQCGSLVVNSLASGSAIPNQTVVPQPASLDTTKPPQLSSFSIASNNVQNLFFGAGSTMTLNFGVNQNVSNVQVKIAGTSVSAVQQPTGLYYAEYRLVGNETLPLPVIISFTNSAGLSGKIYSWIGNTTALPTSLGDQIVSSSGSTFYRQLSLNSKGADVTALQNKLTTDGFYSGPITGTLGSLTQAAVKKYQSAHGLKQTGGVGPATLKLLNEGK